MNIDLLNNKVFASKVDKTTASDDNIAPKTVLRLSSEI